MLYNILNQFQLAPKYTRYAINELHTLLVAEHDSRIITAPIAIKILYYLTAANHEVSIFDDFSTNEILLQLKQLEVKGIITKKTSIFSKEQEAFWQELGYDTSRLSKLFQQKTLKIISLGSTNISEFTSLCKTTGLSFSETPDIYIVLTDSYIHPELETLNQSFIEKQQPWLLIKLTGATPYIGPLFSPTIANMPCWSCLQHRLLLHDRENALYQTLHKTLKNIQRPLVTHQLAQQIVISRALLLLVEFWYTVHDTHVLQNHIHSINTKTGEITKHQIIKRPQCSHCGTPEILTQYPKPITLQRETSLATHHGGYRIYDAETTYNNYKHHISSITGIVPYVKPYHKSKDIPIFNYGSGKNIAMQSTSMFWLNLHLRSANGGKGKTDIQAKTGALCEAIERYCLMFPGATYTISNTFNALDRAIHPNSCMLFSKQQYNERIKINASSTKFYSLIPDYLSKDQALDWSPVYNLTKKHFNYVPTAFCYAQYQTEAATESKIYAYPDSNGAAAGNTIEEAILQGLFELIERDAAAIWWYNRIPRPAINLDTLQNSYVDQMQAHYKSLDRSLYVLELTVDTQIPVYAAISYCLKTKRKILYAFGAHIDPTIAIERAIIELNQLLPIVTSSSTYLTKDKTFIQWLDTQIITQHPFLQPDDIIDFTVKQDIPTTIYDSINYSIKHLANLGLDVLIFNLTQPDIGMPVVKVIVPGLRHFWRRTAPGRLFDVPVKLGWLQQPYTEEQLNPISIFI